MASKPASGRPRAVRFALGVLDAMIALIIVETVASLAFLPIYLYLRFPTGTASAMLASHGWRTHLATIYLTHLLALHVLRYGGRPALVAAGVAYAVGLLVLGVCWWLGRRVRDVLRVPMPRVDDFDDEEEEVGGQ